MKTVTLSRGYVATVDDEDFYGIVGAYTWSAAERPNGRVYAVRNVRVASGEWRQVLMHREILGLTGSRTPDVDHIDRDGLNNCRSNLRVASRSQNNANQLKEQGGRSSRFKGVSYVKAKRKWRASVKVDGRAHHLGYFATEEEAAGAYDVAARDRFGSFARLNGAKQVVIERLLAIIPDDEGEFLTEGLPEWNGSFR